MSTARANGRRRQRGRRRKTVEKARRASRVRVRVGLGKNLDLPQNGNYHALSVNQRYVRACNGYAFPVETHVSKSKTVLPRDSFGFNSREHALQQRHPPPRNRATRTVPPHAWARRGSAGVASDGGGYERLGTLPRPPWLPSCRRTTLRARVDGPLHAPVVSPFPSYASTVYLTPPPPLCASAPRLRRCALPSAQGGLAGPSTAPRTVAHATLALRLVRPPSRAKNYCPPLAHA